MKKLCFQFLAVVFAVGLISPVSMNTAYAEDAVVMTVNGTEYTSHADGWSAAVTTAGDGTPTTVKMLADWVAPGGIFSGKNGTYHGSLHLNNSNIDLTIDMNGHKIDRNLSAPANDGNGVVFYVESAKSLKICDTKGGGLITGANNKGGFFNGRGGAFFIDKGDLTLENVTISGNKSDDMGGAVWVKGSDIKVTIDNCTIRDNMAKTGGAITAYNEVDMYISNTTICSNEATAGMGGAVYWGSKGVLHLLENVTICHNKVTGNDMAPGYGGAIAGVTPSANLMSGYGGGLIVYEDSVNISYNTADYGGGIYWGAMGNPVLLGGHMTGNYAREQGGGYYGDTGKQTTYGGLYLGGNIRIMGNTSPDGASNVYLSGADQLIRHALAHDDEKLRKPLGENACIGITSPEDIWNDKCITAGDSQFTLGDYRYFYEDSGRYNLLAFYDENDDDNNYQIWCTTRNPEDYGVNKVAILEFNKELLTDVSVDNNKDIITLTANNRKKLTFENYTLDFLIEYDTYAFSIEDTDRACNMLEPQSYVIFGKEGAYELFKVQVVPGGGEWSASQDEPMECFHAHVMAGDKLSKYVTFEEAWAYALQQASEGIPVTFTLMHDWVAKSGAFKGIGTKKGCLYLNDADIDLSIDLNGYKINRNLKTATADGQVFKIDNGKVTITDSVGTGKITGGNTTGYGGAFWVEYGSLYIKGGEISDNKAEYGGAVYCNDLDDAFVYIEGGKISGNTATENGGGIYMYDGYLYMEDGEITGNTAKKGAGIYWESDNVGCFTKGKISGNNATEAGGGIYATDDGGLYFGGTIVISGNNKLGQYPDNLYLEDDDVYVNRTAGQTDEIPDVPLVDGASIGISMPATSGTVLISGPDSRFDSNNFGYFFGDNSGYFVRAVFDEWGKENTHKLYYNTWGYKDAVYPKIKTVAVRENNGLISEASIDVDKQIITLKAISSDKSLFKSVVVEKLVSFITSNDADVYWRFCDVAFDLTAPFEYKVVSKSTGTYVHCRVVVEFPECEHADKNGDNICDVCGESVLTCVTDYNAQTKTVTVSAAKSGKYTLIFADYESGRLDSASAVEYEFKTGINTVPNENITLGSDDKIMLWYDLKDCIPVCKSFILK